MLKVAIVGGGPSAACVVDALANHPGLYGQLDVTVFEPRQRLWHGQVFQPEGDEVLANVPMEAMSVRASDPQHGVRWLRAHALDDPRGDEVTYPPRRVVGEYLQDAGRDALAALDDRGSAARVEHGVVRALTQRGSKLWVIAEEKMHGPFDHTVLCPGGPPSHDPYVLTGQPGYIANTYPLRSSLAEVSDQARVAILGSGLTAVDVVMALRARGHQGPISLVSRTGLLPAVRPAATTMKHTRRHLTVAGLEQLAGHDGKLELTDLIGLVQAELLEAGLDPAAITAALDDSCTAPERLREELDHASVPDPGWSLIRDAMVACGQDAWYLLRADDKNRIRGHHQTLMRMCCPMPAGNAERLLEMFDTGQLDLVPSVTAVRRRRGQQRGFQIRAARDLVADVVVAATTPATHLPSPGIRTLLTSLVSQGMAAPHPYGGLRVERQTSRVLNEGGVPDERLHALGDITQGAYLFTFGMPVLARRAFCIADDIATGHRPATAVPAMSEGVVRSTRSPTRRSPHRQLAES